MRIKPTSLVVLAILMGFFGYLSYQELWRDNATHASSEIVAQLTKLSVKAEDPVKPPEYFGLKRAEIALQEYKKHVTEQTPGCNCGPEIDLYTEGNPAQWCAMFVSWVTKEAGAPLNDPSTQSWRFTNSRQLIEYLKQSGTWHSREDVIAQNLKPQLGDFVFFYRGDLQDNLGHVDIVVDQSGPSGIAGLIGGNIRGQVLYRADFPYQDHYGFLGFGHPEK